MAKSLSELEHLSPQSRGYALEQWFYDRFADRFDDHNLPFRTGGGAEQIDGAFKYDSKWYLAEFKWVKNRIPASEIYAFKGKVDGKLAGTYGIFVSYTGFSDECADALTLGKTLNVILFDGEDLADCEKGGIDAVLDRKIKAASLKGIVYKSKDIAVIGPGKSGAPNRAPKLEILVEGSRDGHIISMLIAEMGLVNSYVIVPCGGKIAVLKYAAEAGKDPKVKRLVVVDSDGDPTIEQRILNNGGVDVAIVVEPEIEALFYPNDDDPKSTFSHELNQSGKNYVEFVKSKIANIVSANVQGVAGKIRLAAD